MIEPSAEVRQPDLVHVKILLRLFVDGAFSRMFRFSTVSPVVLFFCSLCAEPQSSYDNLLLNPPHLPRVSPIRRTSSLPDICAEILFLKCMH